MQGKNMDNYKKCIGILFEKTIGDIIYTSSIVASIRKNEPDAFIHVITSEMGMEILNSDKPDYNKISTKFESIINYDIIYQPLRCAQFRPAWYKYGLHIRDLSAKSISINLSVTHSNIINIKDEEVSDECRKIKDKRYIIVNNRASQDRLKEVPINIMNDLLAVVSKDFPVFQIGLAQEPHLSNCELLLGETSLKETLYLIKNAAMVIGIDNFVIHSAGAYNVPYLGIYGQYDAKQVGAIDDVENKQIVNHGIFTDYNIDGCKNITVNELTEAYFKIKDNLK
jgi:ADP-heptose:LPS heptosyltransferase